MTDQTKACLFKCKYIIKQRHGLMAIIGKIGFGKTSTLRYLVNEFLDDPKYKMALLPNGNFSTDMQFIKFISGQLSLPPRRSLLAQVEEIHEFAQEVHDQGGNVVLFVDEAQSLKLSQLDLIRELLNLETNESKIIQIILAGQPEMENKLRSKPELASRVMLVSYLDTFTFEDMERALNYRITMAGGHPEIIGDEARHTLYLASRGVPREVVKIASAAMLLAAIAEERAISAEMIETAAENTLRTEAHDEQKALVH
jgi:type II secretory pathway predicted ATPase ExeA